MIDPDKDGVEYINIWTKGKTELGRNLTNLAPISFTHPEHGKFATLEGYWYWLATGKCNDQFKTLSGYEAKQLGKTLPKVPNPTFIAEFTRGMLLRLNQNGVLARDLRASTLPLKHFYNYGGKIIDCTEKHQWQLDVYDAYRNEPDEVRLLIAGSRTINDYDMIRDVVDWFIRDRGLSERTVFIVSGLAWKGPDNVAIEYCRKRGYKLLGYPANWDLYSKRAGMIRNAEMAKIVTHGVVFWDNESSGTKNMIELLLKNGIDHHIHIATRS